MDKPKKFDQKPAYLLKFFSPFYGEWVEMAEGLSSQGLHVAMVSPEITPFTKVGGLGDVLGALPLALERLGLRLSLIMPAYRSVIKGDIPLEETGIRFSVPISNRREEGVVLKGRAGENIPVYFIHADKYFDRDFIYGTPEGDYPDNAERFTFFCRAVLELLRHDPPQILHAHEWESALSIVFLKAQPHLYPELSSTKTVFTIHNLGYQGLFLKEDWHLLNLDWNLFDPRYLEFYERINFLKGGIVFADRIITVSPSYAQEIQSQEQGCGLDGVLRERREVLVGILNGADYTIWNPRTNRFIAQRYSARAISGKKACKADLQRYFGLPQKPHTPLIGMISRLAEQKGLDLLEKALEEFLRRDLQFVFLGIGDRRYQEMLSRAAEGHPEKVGVRFVFDEALAHRIIAGADLLLMPSRYEPCGLVQIYGFKYGTIPIVRAIGGLRDTVEEFDPETGKGNGFLFGPYEPEAFLEAVDRALALFPQRGKWLTLIRNAMRADFSWERSAKAYLNLYQRLLRS